MLISQAPLGFSITHAFKKVGHGITSVGKEAGHLAVKGAKLNIKLLTLPTMELEKHVLAPILHTVLTPVRHKVDTLKDRRAKKIAWDSRKSTVPTPAERVQAKAWAKSYLKREKPPFGLMLSMLAGPPLYGVPEPTMRGFGGLGDPATATIIASVPTLLAIMASILSRSSSNGEAPAGAPGGAGGGAAAPTAPDAPGTVDLTPTQDAADASAAAAGGDDAGADDSGGDGGGKKGKHGKGGGGGAGGVGKMLGGLTKKQMMIGGAILGGAVLLALLTSKKS